jgi:uncharacterized delta-60 repeat protein
VAGRIFAPGSSTGIAIGLTKYKQDGSLDTAFGASHGKVIKDALLSDVTGMTLDTHDRIIVVGPTPTGTGGNADFGVVRFLPNGAVDTSFAGDGGTFVGFDLGGDNEDLPTAVLTDSTDRIVVLGSVAVASTWHLGGMARILPSGTLDPTFGNVAPVGGKSVFGSTLDSQLGIFPKGLVARPDGDFVICATAATTPTTTSIAVVGVSSNGAEYGTSQSQLLISAGSRDLSASSISLRGLSSTIVAGNMRSFQGAPEQVVACKIDLAPFGELRHDATFGQPCFLSLQAGRVNDVAVRGDASTVLVGLFHAPDGSTHQGMVVVVLPDGTPDTHFSRGGVRYFQAPTSSVGQTSFATGFSKVVLDAQRPVVVGYRSDDNRQDSNRDFVALRMQSDLVFNDGFD